MTREEQIAYFNSLNASIELNKAFIQGMNEKEVRERIFHWRDIFFNEFKRQNKPKEKAPSYISDEEPFNQK